MGEEHPRPDLLAEVDEVLVRPGRADVAVQARIDPLAVPADAETVAVGLRLRLGRVERLVDQRVRRCADEVGQEDRLTGIGEKAAHDWTNTP